jgi:translocation and assembly module TamA
VRAGEPGRVAESGRAAESGRSADPGRANERRQAAERGRANERRQAAEPGQGAERPRGAEPARAARGLALICALAGFPAAAEVELRGVDGNVAQNVLAFLTLDDLACEAPEQTVRRELNDAPGRIREAVSVYGYYSPRIEPSFETGDDCWTARFAIDLGEPVRIRTLDLRLEGAAATDPEFTNVVETTPLAVGGPLNHAVYDRLKRRLSDLARDRGYPRASFTASTIDVYPDERAADIVVRFESGERYRFGDIDLEQEVLRDEFVQAFIDLDSGDAYDNRKLTAVYAALNDSGYFENIDVRPLAPDHESQTIPVQITLTAARRRLIRYGVGFSTDMGPRLRFGRTIRRWNDRGHQLSVDALLSQVVTEVSANYRLPFGDPRFEWASFDAGIKSEDTDTSESESLLFGARRVLQRPGGWSRTQLLTLAVEDFEVGSQQGRSRLLMPGVDWSRTRADGTLRPARGSKVDFELRGAGETLGSDTTFLQFVTGAKWITSLASSARVLVRGTLGVTWEDDFAALPPSVRFFAGGDNSIRGYAFEALGPEDANGDVIGGPRLVIGSVEYEHPVRPRWSVAAFTDFGNAFDGSDIDIKTSAGIGARWQSPLGPVRLDIGVPLDDPEHDARLHVSLGPDL